MCVPFASDVRPICVRCASHLHPSFHFATVDLLSCAHQGILDPLKARPACFGPVRASFPTLKSVISGRTPYAPFGADKYMKTKNNSRRCVAGLDPMRTLDSRKLLKYRDFIGQYKVQAAAGDGMALSASIKVRLREGQALVYAAQANSAGSVSQPSSATVSTKLTG
jgi:hypothetical protein